MATSVAVVERRYVGGQCPNVACLPSKNVIYSARVVSLARRGPEFGLAAESISINMQAVQARKRKMVENLVQMLLERYAASGAELIMGEGRFIAPRTVAVSLNTGDERVIKSERVFLDLGTRATMLRDGKFTHPTAAEGLTMLLSSVPKAAPADATGATATEAARGAAARPR